MNAGLRIGHGYDAHRFGGDRALMLGGVAVPHHQGLIAHSDGDVVLHALCDALLGAAGLGDIGRHFPDSDARFKDADSRDLVRETRRLLAADKLFPVNVDLTVIAQVPRLSPHIDTMRETIASDLSIARRQVKCEGDHD